MSKNSNILLWWQSFNFGEIKIREEKGTKEERRENRMEEKSRKEENKWE